MSIGKLVGFLFHIALPLPIPTITWRFNWLFSVA